MKNITRRACIALASLATAAVLTACGGNAYAGTLPESFKADNGKVFQIHSVLSVEYANGTVIVKQATGSAQPFPDATGAVWSKVLASTDFYKHYVQVPGTVRYMNTSVTTEISCISNQSVFGYPQGQPEFFADACALHNAVKNAAQ